MTKVNEINLNQAYLRRWTEGIGSKKLLVTRMARVSVDDVIEWYI